MPAQNKIFSEWEIKTLYKLLTKLQTAYVGNDEISTRADHFTIGERTIISTVRQWVKWFAQDEMKVDIGEQ